MGWGGAEGMQLRDEVRDPDSVHAEVSPDLSSALGARGSGLCRFPPRGAAGPKPWRPEVPHEPRGSGPPPRGQEGGRRGLESGTGPHRREMRISVLK